MDVEHAIPLGGIDLPTVVSINAQGGVHSQGGSSSSGVQQPQQPTASNNTPGNQAPRESVPRQPQQERQPQQQSQPQQQWTRGYGDMGPSFQPMDPNDTRSRFTSNPQKLDEHLAYMASDQKRNAGVSLNG